MWSSTSGDPLQQSMRDTTKGDLLRWMENVTKLVTKQLHTLLMMGFPSLQKHLLCEIKVIGERDATRTWMFVGPEDASESLEKSAIAPLETLLASQQMPVATDTYLTLSFQYVAYIQYPGIFVTVDLSAAEPPQDDPDSLTSELKWRLSAEYELARLQDQTRPDPILSWTLYEQAMGTEILPLKLSRKRT